MRRPQVGRDQGLDRAPGQLAAPVTEYLFQPPVRQREFAVVADQRHPVAQRVDKIPQDSRRDNRNPGQRLLIPFPASALAKRTYILHRRDLRDSAVTFLSRARRLRPRARLQT